jgi:Ca2+-binding EF-hand superfamily protein
MGFIIRNLKTDLFPKSDVMESYSRFILALVLWFVLGLVSSAADPKNPQQADPRPVPPVLAELLKGNAQDFIRRFDKDKKGYLKKDDLPPRLANLFMRGDKNGDGKLDRQEVAQLLNELRKRYGMDKPAAPSKEEVERVVNQILARMDTNKDGKISRDEAQGNIKAAFDQLDKNKDGFLDRNELRQAAVRFLANRRNQQPQSRPSQPRPPELRVEEPDFDALDLNADGRLTREELKGTPYADKFDAMDTNKDGKIDRKEFSAYFRREAEKKQQAEKQEIRK